MGNGGMHVLRPFRTPEHANFTGSEMAKNVNPDIPEKKAIKSSLLRDRWGYKFCISTLEAPKGAYMAKLHTLLLWWPT